MHSPETPKTPSGNASKGTVKVITGCRPLEAAGLQGKHITPDDIIFDQAVVDSVRGGLKDGLKTQLKQKFPINEQLRRLLTTHRPSQAKQSDLVFLSPEGQFMNFLNFRNRGWSSVLEELGIRYRQPHQVRHPLITHCVEEVRNHHEALCGYPGTLPGARDLTGVPCDK